ncbi:Electron transfer flavoprotein, alpha/beta-subunit-like protein [Alkaliphilus metalliredigens QYMF]|uniref:Electron transfer flavoprotein, alpha/beta-subunit-like protein n=1 Tax=Alkaliphilus metalliredigens (strain QYMF) TaxID=293826 RepID=A6TSR1_ALKMQ|nr:electron transfer flavoprotein subunit alpha/FixB family protein [Alkaliphilus metalliredigens]ABR49229.1 Electron transfer flavoprotein, alpha/beta-subunit-like protein [Alkaliphilus metalliredigens QYMF]
MSLVDYKGVLVYIEQRDKEIQKVSLELLGKGKEIADKLGEGLSAVIMGNDITGLAQELIYHGAEKVIVVDDKILENFATEPYTKALTAVINQEKPEVVLVGATSIGRDLAPRVSARIHTGLTADCTVLDVEEETRHLLMTRPAFGGNIMATIICPDHRPQMSTVRPGVMVKLDRDTSKEGEIVLLDAGLVASDLNIEILEIVKEDKKKVNIEDATILISAGRGMGSKENMEPLYRLSEELKAEVSGSRAVIDNGWLDKERQVGQTGKTVRPDLYIACGISGAIQHVAGMEESELIIAINKSHDAPIFDVADLGIVGDASKILALVTEEIRKSKN